MKHNYENIEGWVRIRRGIIEHIRKMNRKGGKDGKADLFRPPSPWGLFQAHLLTANFRTGICSLTDEQWAELFGCCVKSIRRAKRPLIERGYLMRLYPNRPDVFIPKYARYIKESGTWVRLGRPEVLKSRQVDTDDHSGGQIRPLRWTPTTTQVDTAVHTNSDKSLEDKESQHPNKLIRDKEINGPVLKSHQSQNSLDTSLNLTEKIQADWKKYWPDYPVISQRDIEVLLSEPLTEHDSPKLRVEFIREAIHQAAQYREEIGKKIDFPVTWIFSGLHHGTKWLRDRTINALEEKREAQIRAGHRGSKEDWKTMETIMDGVKEYRSKNEKEITDPV